MTVPIASDTPPAPPGAMVRAVSPACDAGPPGKLLFRQALGKFDGATVEELWQGSDENQATGGLRVGELVADAPRGEDERRLPRIGLELLAQTADDGVDGAFGDVCVAAPDGLQQAGPAEDDAAA